MKNIRDKRDNFASTVIVLGALAGGLALTNHFVGPLLGSPTPSPTSNASGSTQPSSSASAAPAGKTGTASGSPIQYRYGVIQLSVTKAAGKITDVGLVQASASGGRDQAFSYLVADAIKAQGTNFANLSGATYTTDAFKQALDSAIQKLG